ncbi:MAG: hypothetical protein L0I89_06680 [Tetragenococcus halophilus]|uniref:hypothetical protein n=1 Tax=Tetragenococcus halophilus TaxID=51669 RepID=UPI000CAD28F7|nr:hypothetical protein [Tetragenococcus halophilus]MCF1601539.1 hypothetical protein [Tetragenococcus halophilus]MCF1685563.1 hypothetical protein [Tetragenococcus halophilus]MCO7027061.1 hypothetical protein [Tetragenococcus halophilus]MCO8284661.1 hypothetical protein [Tetragenococcus halophilus]MCO8286061.1 hypothetical protein [Tetragenococcus halophilus]
MKPEKVLPYVIVIVGYACVIFIVDNLIFHDTNSFKFIIKIIAFSIFLIVLDKFGSFLNKK